MPDIALDTNTLADFLAQYFHHPRGQPATYLPAGTLSVQAAREISRIATNWHTTGLLTEVVVASAFGFVEVARKWDAIVSGRFTVWQMQAFLQQVPPWFVVASLDASLVDDFLDVPTHIITPDERREPIEGFDAVHVATAYSRDQQSAPCRFCTTDHRLRLIPRLQGRIL